MTISQHTKKLLILFVAIITAAVIVIATFGLKVGIDFTGGTLTEITYSEAPEKAVLEAELQAFELGAYSLRGTEADGQSGYVLRTKALNETERADVHAALTAIGTGAEIERYTAIGPVIGSELTTKAWLAAGATLFIILMYVAFVFRKVPEPVSGFTYGKITIIALMHDLLVPIAAMSILGIIIGAEVDVLFVTALLAILGYSVNDTVVIFDRVRSHLLREKARIEEDEDAERRPISDIIDAAFKQSLGRSINTSLTTLLALGALYFLGGEVTRVFALTLMIGVVAGTYSSLFVANPLLLRAAYRAQAKRFEEASEAVDEYEKNA